MAALLHLSIGGPTTLNKAAVSHQKSRLHASKAGFNGVQCRLSNRESTAPAAHRVLSPFEQAGPSGQSCPAAGGRCNLLYSRALQLTRGQKYDLARQAFEDCVSACPTFILGWVSWAQMEKRTRRGALDRYARCREVLQRGLTLNPASANLCQAWGLMELQRGNVLAAVLLLERCAALDPACSPVLRWKAVALARQTVGPRRVRAPRTAAPLHTSTGGFA